MSNPVVHKYELPAGRNVKVEMPKWAEILHVGFQQEPKEGLFIWALVDPDKPMESHSFTVVGSGEEIGWDILFEESRPKHLGTVVYRAMVWHVFEGQW